MTRKVQIEWPDFKTAVIMELADGENPRQCDEFWNGLPFNTIFAASMSAGDMFKIPIPIALSDAPPEKLAFFPDVPPGTVLSLGWGSLLMKYGEVAEPFRLPRIGTVREEDLPKLFTVSAKLKEAYFFTKVINKAYFTRYQEK